MKNFKKIVLAVMLLCSVNTLSADSIMLMNVNGNEEFFDTIDDAINKIITRKYNKFIKLYIYGSESFGPEKVKSIASALVDSNCKLTKLIIETSNIGSVGTQYIAEVLPKSNLTELKISSSNIGDAGAKALSEALKNRNCKLTVLDIGGNKISAKGAHAIAKALKDPNCKLTSLIIYNNKIKDKGAITLTNALKNKNCKLTSLFILSNLINNDKLKENIYFTMELCAINNLKRMIENDEMNENNYKEIINNAYHSINTLTNSNNTLIIEWYNSLQNKELTYLGAEYKKELADHNIENRDAAVKYIQDKFDYLENELMRESLNIQEEYTGLDEFKRNEKLMKILGVSGSSSQN
ncbi:hypothetical protein KJ644_01310 [Candidatus Dependentiae bacterium]|nr:hypothetical protein [Candidatus Dependentiae bacterium]MBU4387089.1 hypothetical protein [Candidatus Dependentiae bacterium]MCG2756240.1 hypothetical protein [Candidatus Dependentiae bacterium]